MGWKTKSAILQEFLGNGKRSRCHYFALTRKRSVVRITYRPLAQSH
jgi:hypothetical protein